MRNSSDKLIVAMMYLIMLVIAHIYQPAVALSSIGMDDAIQSYFGSINALKRLFAFVRYHFGIYSTITFEYSEYHGFTRSSTPSFT